MIKFIKKFFSIIGWILIGLVLFINVYNLIDQGSGYNAPILGYRASVIVSNSMSFIDDSNKDYLEGHDEYYRIYKNDMIFTKSISYDEVEKYDVVTYYMNGNLICHRVIDKYESDNKRYIVTRGDANNVDDSPFEESLLKGKVIGVASGIGIIFSFFQSLYGLLAIFICLFFIFLGMYIISKDDKYNIDIKKIKLNKKIKNKQSVIKFNKDTFRSILNDELRR